MNARSVAISGHTDTGLEGVADAFAENFMNRGELGGACSMYEDGVAVVDLRGGIRKRETGEPWEKDTTVIE